MPETSFDGNLAFIVLEHPFPFDFSIVTSQDKPTQLALLIFDSLLVQLNIRLDEVTCLQYFVFPGPTSFSIDTFLDYIDPQILMVPQIYLYYPLI